MKKVFASVLTLAVLLAAGCGAKQEEKPADTTDQTADVEKSRRYDLC